MPADEIPDDVLDLFAFAGEPARIVELASRLFDAGADRVEFGTPHGLDEARGVDLLAERSFRRYARPERAPPAPERATDVMRGSIMRANTSASAFSAMIAVALRNMTPRISGRS